MKTVESKHRRSELKTGLHAVNIHDMFYLRNAEKEILKINGFITIVVRFVGDKKAAHENWYIIDGDFRQKYFQKMLVDAGVVMVPGKQPKKEEVVGKKLYIAIQEVHYVNDEKLVLEDGEPVIEYHVFKTMPFTEKRPQLTGDPELNNGIPMDQFVTYKNVSGYHQLVTKEDCQKMEESPFVVDTPHIEVDNDEIPDFETYE